MEYLTHESKYSAIKERDPGAEGYFIYCVTSTLIFCRPTCSSKLPLKNHVIFCNEISEAIKLGYRPCKRCKPDQEVGWNNTRDIIEQSLVEIHKLVQQGKKFSINDLIKDLNVSKWHFCRSFKNYVKMTPRKYFMECKEKGIFDTKIVLPLIETKKNLRKRRNEENKIINHNSSTSLAITPSDTLSSLSGLLFTDNPNTFYGLDLGYISQDDIDGFFTTTFDDIAMYNTK